MESKRRFPASPLMSPTEFKKKELNNVSKCDQISQGTVTANFILHHAENAERKWIFKWDIPENTIRCFEPPLSIKSFLWVSLSLTLTYATPLIKQQHNRQCSHTHTTINDSNEG